MKSIKIVLLAPIIFDKHNYSLVEKLILNVNKINGDTLFSKNEWDSLDSQSVAFKNTTPDLDITDAILRERNLNPKIYKNFMNSIKINYKSTVLHVDAKLIVNEKHNFLILYEFIFSDLNFEDCNEFIINLMAKRNLFDETKTSDFDNAVKLKSIEIINPLIRKILKMDKFSISIKNFTLDSSYPLIYINGFSNNTNNISNLFINEEDIEQRNNSVLIEKDYKNSFVHIGWNYGIIQNMPKKINHQFLCMLVFLQLTYYLLRFYKNYFKNQIEGLSNRLIFNEEEVRNFDKLKLLYYKEDLNYQTYKSGLFPKFYKEFTNIEILWHLQEDIQIIEKTFDVQNEYINKHFQLESEKTNKNLNYGITVIGLIQIFAIYGIFNDYISLRENVNSAIYFNYATESIFGIMILFVFFIIFVHKKRKE